ncbi:MAG: hypothetical protein ABI614_07330 [Planctomycetota bacterium]
MTISIRCDGCNTTYNLPDEMIGKKAKCKKCGQLLTVTAPPPKQPAPSAKIETMCGQCGAKYSVALAMIGKRVKCQKCGGAFDVADPNAAPLAELAADPFGDIGAGDWGDPLGGAMAMPATHYPPANSMPGRPVAKKPGGGGVPKIVWIAVGGGGGALLLIVLLVLFLFSGGGDDGGDGADGGGAVASGGGTSGSSSSRAADVELPPLNDSIAWTWTADLPTAGPSSLLQQPLKLLDRPSEVVFASGNVAQAAISFRRNSDGKDDVLIQQLDLKTGQAVAEQAFEKNTKLLDLSRDGTSFLILPGANYASYETLQVWRWANKAAKQAGEWMPYKGQSSKRIAWSMMIDANRIATGHGQEKAATVWDGGGKQVGRFPHEGNTAPLLSPGGRYLVQHSGIWLRFFEAASLKHVGSIGPLSAELTNFHGLVYRPDGKAIGAAFMVSAASRFVAWNATSRQKQTEFEIPILSSPLAWCGDDDVMAGTYLLSLSNEMPVWHYQSLAPFAQTIDRRVWHHLAVGKEQYLAAAAVPSPEVRSNIEKYVAANVPILQTGDAVALSVVAKGTTPSPDFQQNLANTVGAHLRTAGYTIADGSEFTMRVVMEDKDSGRQLEYRTFGGAAGATTVSVPDRQIECEVAFVDSTGKVVWSTKTSIGPLGFSMTRGGETDFAKSLLDARWGRFDSWIKTIKIAGLIRKLSSTGEFGSSTLQADGERIVKLPVN